jgi:hypothetical protein
MRYTRYMAKKSSKSSRHQRVKKKEIAKKKPTAKKPVTAAIIAEGSDEPVVKAETRNQKKPTTAKKAESLIEAVVVDPEVVKFAHESVEVMQPARSRMLLSAVALSVVIVALIFGAAIVRQQSTDKQADQTAKSGQVSGKADEILQSGGSICTNGSSQTDASGSSNPQSVGMMLQSNPTNEIQTPQTLSSGNDASTLQSASCF